MRGPEDFLPGLFVYRRIDGRNCLINKLNRIGEERETRFKAGLIHIAAIRVSGYETASMETL
jgi:hypothetical protein